MYGQSNALELYMLKKELSDLKQNDMNVSEYYGKLKGYWDKINNIEGFPLCSCDAMSKCTCNMIKKLIEREEKNKVIEFLMGLNGGYDNQKQNIIGMEPLPSVNKVYQLVLQVEKQKEISGVMESGFERSALLAGKQQMNYPHQRNNNAANSYQKRESKEDKGKKKCEHCKFTGHNKDECFKLHGYPEWYTKLRPSGVKSGRYNANVNVSMDDGVHDSPLEHLNYEDDNKGSKLDKEMLNAVVHEVLKAMNQKQQGASGSGNNNNWNFAGPY